MILNARANSFYFVFPRGFFPPGIQDKYFQYIKSQSLPYDTLTQFMNSTIQSVSFPSLTAGSVTQTRPLGKTVTYQSSIPIQNMFSQGFNARISSWRIYLCRSWTTMEMSSRRSSLKGLPLLHFLSCL